MLLLIIFQVGLLNYVGQLPLTPKTLSLPLNSPALGSFLSYIPQPSCWVVERSPPQWKVSCDDHLHFRGRTFSTSMTTFVNSNHIWCFFLIWWCLEILKCSDIIFCTLSMDIMLLLTMVIYYLVLMTMLHIKRHMSLDLVAFYLILSAICFPLWELQMLSYKLSSIFTQQASLTLLDRPCKILKKLLHPLMPKKHKV